MKFSRKLAAYLVTGMSVLTIPKCFLMWVNSIPAVNESRIQCTIALMLPNQNRSVFRVCKKTFTKTFGITGKTIETLITRKKKPKN